MKRKAETKPRVLFVAPPVLLPSVFAHYPMFSNIGMLQNAAVLETRGCSVEVLDSFFHEPRLRYRPVDGETWHLGLELDDLARALEARAPADVVVLVITMFSDVHKLDETYFRQAAGLIRRAHPGAYILAADCFVCGMNYFPYAPTALLEGVPALDGVLSGETDRTLPAAVSALAAGDRTASIPGFVDRTRSGAGRDAEAFIAALRKEPPVKDLDALPHPAFHLLDMENYFSCMEDAVRWDLVHEYHEPERLLPLITSRGCRYACNFCTQQVLRGPWRSHSVEYVGDLTAKLAAKYGVSRFLFLDNSINLDRARFRGLVELLARRRQPWDAVNGFRADGLEDDDIVLLKEAGNAKLTVSAESGDAEVLKGIVGKRQDLQHVVRVVRKCKEVGLPSQVHYVIGLPGETKRQINKTLEFAAMLCENFGARPLLQHAIPFRQTRLFRECEEKGWFTEHPDAVPGRELELRSLIRTENHAPEEVARFKRGFGALLDEMRETAVAAIDAGCNNACLHCEREGGASAELSLDDWARRLEAERGRGARDLLITGREPLLRHELAAGLLSLSRSLGFRRRTVATNGRMLIYPRVAEALLAGGLETAQITLASVAPAVHDRITRAEGACAQTLGGVRNLVHRGFGGVSFVVPVTALNLSTLEQTVRVLRPLAPKGIVLRYPTPLAAQAGAVAPYPEAVPVLARILSGPGGDGVTVQGVPFCLFDASLAQRLSPLPAHELPELRRLKAKGGACEECVDFISCGGFWRQEYEPLYRQGACASS